MTGDDLETLKAAIEHIQLGKNAVDVLDSKVPCDTLKDASDVLKVAIDYLETKRADSEGE